jgi:hypothetical protein
MLDASGGVTDLNRIADGVLVFKDNVKTGDDVAHEILRAETNGYAGKSGDGKSRHRVNPDFFHGGQERNGPNDFARRAVQHVGERARLLLAHLRGAAGRGRALDEQPGHRPQKPVNEQRDEEYDEEVESSREREFRPVNGKTGHRFFGKESITLEGDVRLLWCHSLAEHIQGEAHMFDTRRGFLAGLAGVGTLAALAGTGTLGQDPAKKPTRPGPPSAGGESDDSDAMPPKSPTKALLEANEKDIKKNIEKLYQLAADLKAEVEKTDSSQVLSLGLVKKAEEIEKLAHDIKNRAKG